MLANIVSLLAHCYRATGVVVAFNFCFRAKILTVSYQGFNCILLRFSAMTKCFPLLIVCICFCIKISYAQADCSSKYFETSFYRDAYSYTPSVIVLPSGNLIVPSYAAASIFTLLKINRSGDTLWNKRYNISGGNRDDWQQATRLDTDGSLLCALSGDQLVKIDTNGVMLWAKQIQFLHGVERLYDIEIMSDGDKLVFYQASDDGRSLMARLSPDASIVRWCKYFEFSSGSFTNMVVNGNHIVFGGGAPAHDYAFTLYPFIMSVDATTGNLQQLNFYKSDTLSGWIKRLYPCGNGYVGLSYLISPNSWGNHGYIRFHQDLSLQSANMFGGLGINDFYSTSISLAPETDGSFYMAYGGFFNLALSHISNRDSLIYVKDMPGSYSDPTDIQQSKEALYITGFNNFNNVVTQTVGSNAYVVKCDFNGSPGNCEPEQDPTFTLQPLFLPISNTHLLVQDSSIIISSIAAIESTPIPVQANVNCTKQNSCNSIHIKGNAGVCNALPLTFTGTRNAGCSSPVAWRCDTKENYTLTTLSDSTVSIAFAKNGVYKVYAQVQTYCETQLIDSFNVSVNLSRQLNLGNDTFLCKNKLVLHAGNQFQKYLWQDGSTDSVYSVSKEGKYFVTAKDYCGNNLSDTVMISQGPSYSFSAGNDTVLCTGDTLLLRATPGFVNYQWSSSYNLINANNQTISVFPDRGTNFAVQAEKPAGCFVYDTVYVAVITSPQIHLGNDTAFCKGGSLTLDAGRGFDSYVWSTGAATQSITAAQAGTYSVKAKDGFCYSYDTLVVSAVYPLPTVHLSDTVICVNSSLVLQAGPGFQSYQWQDHSSLPQYTITSPGKYWVTVKDGEGCFATDTSTVSGFAALPDHFLPMDTAKCGYDTLLLQPAFSFKRYVWSDGSAHENLKVISAGSYWLQVTDGNGCTNRNYIMVDTKECKNEIYFPSAFTPNGDGHNDLFEPKVLGTIEQFHLLVYNRWGQKVYETRDWQKGWDGYRNGVVQDSETFVWIASYKLQNKAATTAKGTVTLIK